MSSRESDREDLLREATALIERAELQITGNDEPAVVGFRRDGSASFFFGPDPVYQFNAAGELRRAYISGLLYKAERGRLVSLRRERMATEVILIRTELAPAETTALLTALRNHLTHLHEALAGGSFVILCQVPADAAIVSRVLDWLAALPTTIQIADRPNVR